MNKVLISCLAISLFLCGCGANFNSIHRTIELDSGKGALIDAKQRGIFVSKSSNSQSTNNSASANTNEGSSEVKKEVITKLCAEPSPDALSAYAMQLAAEGKVPEGVAGKLALSTQESSSYIGLRTQSIQVLRDSMYRICEAYLSGGIDEGHFELMLRRSQRYMVALLGIEQLTGVVKVPPVVVNTSGSAFVSRPISEIRDEVKQIDKTIAELKTKQTASEDTKEKDEIGKDIVAAEADKKILEEIITKPDALSTSGSANATVIVNAIPSQRTDAHIQAVAGYVTDIVKSVIQTDDTNALCFSLLSTINGAKKEDELTPIQQVCMKQFQNKNTLDSGLIKARLKLLEAAKTPEDLQKLSNQISDTNELIGIDAISRTMSRTLGK